LLLFDCVVDVGCADCASCFGFFVQAETVNNDTSKSGTMFRGIRVS
jgi:hypothetical protein